MSVWFESAFTYKTRDWRFYYTSSGEKVLNAWLVE